MKYGKIKWFLMQIISWSSVLGACSAIYIAESAIFSAESQMLPSLEGRPCLSLASICVYVKIWVDMLAKTKGE